MPESWLAFQMRLVQLEIEIINEAYERLDKLKREEREKWLAAGGKPYEPDNGDHLD